jgi:hypothetical protein
MGANIALEMAGSGAFSGPLVLLAPSFSRPDEAIFLRVLDRLARVLGHLPFAAMLKLMGPAMNAAARGPPQGARRGASQERPACRPARISLLPAVSGPPRPDQ